MTPGADLNMLRANSLYSHSLDRSAIERLVSQTVSLRGWLIFYTHDVRDKPSAFGCTPGELDFVVRLVANNRALRILTVSQALAAITDPMNTISSSAHGDA